MQWELTKINIYYRQSDSIFEKSYFGAKKILEHDDRRPATVG
jgi:hypothetical protein